MDDEPISLLIPGDDMIESRTLSKSDITSKILYVLRMKADGFFFFYIIVLKSEYIELDDLIYFTNHYFIPIPIRTISWCCLEAAAGSPYNFWSFINLSRLRWLLLHRKLGLRVLTLVMAHWLSRTKILTCSGKGLNVFNVLVGVHSLPSCLLLCSSLAHCHNNLHYHLPHIGNDRNRRLVSCKI